MKVELLKPEDIRTVLSNPSQEALNDMKAFGSTINSLTQKAMLSYPLAWSINPSHSVQCVCWYNLGAGKVSTSVFYSDGFLKNKHITLTIKDLMNKSIPVLKEIGIGSIEINSTLSHPLSEKWFERLGFVNTHRTYPLNGHTITIFERRI